MDFKTTRKLQEQSGSYFVVLPLDWVKAKNLKQSDELIVTYGDEVTVSVPDKHHY